MVREAYLEIFYVHGRGNNEKRIEKMYKIGRGSVRQKREIGRWVEEGRIRTGHVNVEKYGYDTENPIIVI